MVAVKIVATFIFVTSVSRLTLFTHFGQAVRNVSEPDPPLKLKKLAEVPRLAF